ncbi:hypothetical protein [Nocardia sp. NPDC057272]|uniref:hypothetical protein n=1 Tax=Nocardia sp. NPDC057272 TaxID=3346079 RepID=UPI00362CBB77
MTTPIPRRRLTDQELGQAARLITTDQHDKITDDTISAMVAELVARRAAGDGLPVDHLFTLAVMGGGVVDVEAQPYVTPMHLASMLRLIAEDVDRIPSGT